MKSNLRIKKGVLESIKTMKGFKTDTQLAADLGLHPSAISHSKNGYVKFSAVLASALICKYGLAYDYVIEAYDEEQEKQALAA
jgi:hypothetical protein